MLNHNLFEDQGGLDDENALLQNLLQYNKQSEEKSFLSSSTHDAQPSPQHQASSEESVSSGAFQEGHFKLLGGDAASNPIKTEAIKDKVSPLEYAMKKEELNHQRQQHESDLSPNYGNDGTNYYQSPRNHFTYEYPEHPITDNKPQDLDILIRIFGEPYSNKIHFWIQILPSVVILGLLIGSGSLLFLFLYKSVFFSWAYDNNGNTDDDQNLRNNQSQNNVDNIVFTNHGEWWWLYITTFGQFLAGLVLLFPKAPNLGEAKTFFHDAVSLQGHVEQTPYVIMSSFISLCSGSSIGPEMVLGAFGTGVATYLGQTRSQQTQQQQLQHINTTVFQKITNCLLFPLTIFHTRQKTQMAFVLCGMGAALGSIFLSPVLAVLIVLELSIAARPSDMRLEAASEAAISNWHGTHDKSNSREQTNSREARKDKGHDYMEQMTLVGFAATFAFVAFQSLESFLMKKEKHSQFHSPVHSEAHLYSDQSQNDQTTNIVHLLTVIPLGACCGVLGAFYLLLNGIFRKIRARICLISKRMGLPDAVAHILIPTFCGLFHGIITVFFPLTLGSGTLILSDVLKVGFNMDKGNFNEMTPLRFLISGIMKLVTSALCLGFGGLVGGQMFPLVFAGACIGIAIPHYLPFLPAHIAIPCCMASITGSFVPIPLTLSAFAMFKMGNTMEMGANVLISSVVAYSCNGGLGLIQRGKETLRLGEEQRSQIQYQTDLNQYLRMDYDANEMVMDPQSKDMVRDVSSIIFV